MPFSLVTEADPSFVVANEGGIRVDTCYEYSVEVKRPLWFQVAHVGIMHLKKWALSKKKKPLPDLYNVPVNRQTFDELIAAMKRFDEKAIDRLYHDLWACDVIDYIDNCDDEEFEYELGYAELNRSIMRQILDGQDSWMKCFLGYVLPADHNIEICYDEAMTDVLEHEHEGTVRIVLRTHFMQSSYWSLDKNYTYDPGTVKKHSFEDERELKRICKRLKTPLMASMPPLSKEQEAVAASDMMRVIKAFGFEPVDTPGWKAYTFVNGYE